MVGSWDVFMSNVIYILSYNFVWSISMFDIIQVFVVLWIVAIVLGFVFRSDSVSDGSAEG
jgi:hypothetical protein